MALNQYRTKRRFDVTPEPRGRKAHKGGDAFVIQKHAARRLHYDLRLELDGVMLSWAVTRGPSLVPGEKRLAVHVEDHPIDYNKFEGTIPAGQYGAGTVMIWDRGRWTPDGDARKGYRKGQLDFELDGEKLGGRWHLVRMRKRPGERQDPWLLIKSKDEAARSTKAPDILEEAPLSVASGRSMDEIAAGVKRAASKRPADIGLVQALRAARKPSPPLKRAAKPMRARAKRRSPASAERNANVLEAAHLTNPTRVYWEDVELTKRGLAAYYAAVWPWIEPYVTGRVLSLVRCPEGANKTCFFQKHASAGLEADRLTLVPDDGDEVIAIESLDGLLALVQAGVLEIHVRGSRVEHLADADRIVFDLDPGPGVEWGEIIAAARELRKRLAALELDSWLKTTGGKGLHVVVPVVPTPWEQVKPFARSVAEAMETEAPERFVSVASKAKRRGRIFLDYLRNSREATAICAFSTRARAGAPVSVPLAWDELPSLKASSQYTVGNLMRRLKRLKRDPWADMAGARQQVPAKSG